MDRVSVSRAEDGVRRDNFDTRINIGRPHRPVPESHVSLLMQIRQQSVASISAFGRQ
jgi:hypothetical protein